MKVKKLKIYTHERVFVDISFEVKRSLALVGQSGSGKSLTLKALLGMLPKDMQSEMEIEADFALERGKSVALVPQNPFTALSPLTKIKKQFFVSQKRLEELFGELDLPLELLERFSPELSGGQLQRVVIAMALSHKPRVLLLDEPTTALDPQTRTLILNLLLKLQKREAFSILFVTHDITSAEYLCEDICVIESGKLRECGKMAEVIHNSTDTYTQTLIEANFAHRKFRE